MPTIRAWRSVLFATWLAVCLCVGSASAASHREDAEIFILRVIVRTPAAIARLTEGRYDVLEARDGDALFVLGNRAILQSLRGEGFEVSVHARLPNQQTAFVPFSYFGGYRTVAEHYAHMNAIADMYPELALVVDYGDSWRKINSRPNGHDLLAICITKRRPNDCQLTPNTDKPRFLLIAAIHARELSTSEMAWRWIDELVNHYGQNPDITWLLDYHEMWVIPVANPDGRHLVEQGGGAPYLQRKNMNDSAGTCSPPGDPNYVYFQPGVDLNRNASFKWGVAGSSSAPCAQTYRGTGAASEPEQLALEALMTLLFPDARGPLDSDAAPITTTGAMLTLHSFSDLILLPWGWTNCSGPCPPSQRAPNDAGLRAFAFRMSYYNGYAVGQASELLYPASGTTDDWAYGVLGVPSFTFEIGPMSGSCGYFTPDYACQDGLFWPLNRGAFLYAAKVARQPYALAHGPTTLSVTLSSSAVISGQAVTLTALVRDDAYGSAANSIGRPIVQQITAVEARVNVPHWAGGTPLSMTAQDGAFDAPSEIAIAVLDTSGLGVGRHLIFVRAQNAAGHWGPPTAQWLTVLGSQRWYLPIAYRE